jgi:hypothetical protein
VDIRIDNWRLVTVEVQNQLMAEIKEWFQFPPEFEKSIERAALLKISKAWRRFKSELTNKFVRKGQSPFNQYGFLDPEVYRTFAEMRSTPEFERLSARQRELSARNKHPHRLGTAGYEQAEEKWAREDQIAIAKNVTPPFAGLQGRAHSWIRARAKSDPSSGTTGFPDPAVEEVAQRMV